MTNSRACELEIELLFLVSGNYEAQIFQDGINPDRMASDFQKLSMNKPIKLKIKMTAGSGYAAHLMKQ